MYKICICLCVMLFHIACKHTHDIDPLLKEAYDIQHEAIHIGEDALELINKKIADSNTSISNDSLKMYALAIEGWKKEMIEVPGIVHDHDGHNHADHHHGPPNESGALAAQLTPLENKNLQEGWKQVIVGIFTELKNIEK